MTSEFTPPPARRPSSASQSPQPARPVQAGRPAATAGALVVEPEEAAAEAQVSTGQTYVVESKWAGLLWGGWGSEGDVARILNRRASQGYRLVHAESRMAAWMMIIPRPKLLFFFERVR